MALQLNPALDTTYLNQVYGDDASIVQIIFEAFLSDSLPRWEGLLAVLESENLIDAASIVHGIKPSFTMAGLTEIRPKVEELELAIHAETPTSDLIAHYHRISEDINVIVPILKEEADRLSKL
jgi:hypothetical protein